MDLRDVRVLDLSILLPGPYATQLLADAGADVIKVERVDGGDPAREVASLTGSGTERLFEIVNHGKRSVAIDLSTEDGQDVFASLAESTDVVFEQFRPGVVDRLGVDYETVRKYNEDIIYCSLTGYGQEAPLANRVGHDLNYLGQAGMLDLTRPDTDHVPVQPGYVVADMAGGLFAAFSIVCALLSRELGGAGGEYLDVSMTDVIISFGQGMMADALDGKSPRPGENQLTGGVPWYDVYETADGKYMAFAALEPRFWDAFCEAIDRTDLLEARKRAETEDVAREALREELDEVFVSRTRDEWESLIEDVDAMLAPVLSPSEVIEDDYTVERELVCDPPGYGGWIDFPAKSSAGIGPSEDRVDVPDLGKHTEAVLAEVGINHDRIKQLRDDSVIN